MPDPRIRSFKPWLVLAAFALAGVAGALLWFLPGAQTSEFRVGPAQQACMTSVAVSPSSRVAEFRDRGPRGLGNTSPEIELLLSGPGYQSRVRTGGGARTGHLNVVPIAPPAHTLVATACFVNRGQATAYLDGTAGTTTIPYSMIEIGGRRVSGEISLGLRERAHRSPFDLLSETFSHASNLTDGLMPAWLIWIIAALAVVGVPVGVFAAFYVALREDDAASVV